MAGERHPKADSDHLYEDHVSLDDVMQKCLPMAEAEVEFFGKKTWKDLFSQWPWTSHQRAVGIILLILLSFLLGLLLYFRFASSTDSERADSHAVDSNIADSYTADSNTADSYTVDSNTDDSYTADSVTLHPLDSQSSSLSGSVCGDHRCSSHFGDKVTDVLVTADSRVVLLMGKQQSMVVQSSAGLHTIRLSCVPLAVTQLSSSVLAVTCSFMDLLLLVSLDSTDPTDHEIQRVQTDKEYWYVAPYPLDNTLIGATGDGDIDVITLQGKVLRTLVDSSHNKLTFSLTAAGEYLLVTDFGTKQIHRIHLLASEEHSVEDLAGTLPYYPTDTAVDSAGNVFVVLFDGSVSVRGSQGQYRQLKGGLGEGEEYYWCRIALHGHRLLLLTVTWEGDNYTSDITEYQLVHQ